MNSVAKYRAHVHYGYQKTTLHAVDSISYSLPRCLYLNSLTFISLIIKSIISNAENCLSNIASNPSETVGKFPFLYYETANKHNLFAQSPYARYLVRSFETD